MCMPDAPRPTSRPPRFFAAIRKKPLIPSALSVQVLIKVVRSHVSLAPAPPQAVSYHAEPRLNLSNTHQGVPHTIRKTAVSVKWKAAFGQKPAGTLSSLKL